MPPMPPALSLLLQKKVRQLLVFLSLFLVFGSILAQETIIISGAGPAGLATAISLLARGQDVIVVEQRNEDKWGTRKQVLGLSAESKSFLQSIGVGPQRFRHVDHYAFYRASRKPEVATAVQTLPYGRLLRMISGGVLRHNPDELIVIGELERDLLSIYRFMGGQIEFDTRISNFDGKSADIENKNGIIKETPYKWLINTEGAHSDMLGKLGAIRTVTEAWPTLYFSGEMKGDGLPAEIRYSLKSPGQSDFVSTFFLTNGRRFSAGLDMRGIDFDTATPEVYPAKYLMDLGLNANMIQDLRMARIQITQSHLDRYFFERHRAFVISDAAHSVNPLTAYGINIAFDEAEYISDLLSQEKGVSNADIKAFEDHMRRNVKLAEGNHRRYSFHIPLMTHGNPRIVDGTIKLLAKFTCKNRLTQ